MDLHATRAAILAGHRQPLQCLDAAIAQARSKACAHAFVRTCFDSAREQTLASTPDQPLAGLPFSVKDLFDVQAQPTPAGSVVLANSAPAAQHAPAVQRLLNAGGALIGRTNMTEFAFSGVGINPHHGTPHNAADAQVARVPGGSSSGAAVSVALGAAYIGLGSDTGGSIRIPAALNGIVGFKSTARLVPTAGTVPLSTTLDTACAMTRTVRDTILAHEILAARRVERAGPALGSLRLGVPRTLFLDDLEPQVARDFERALARLRDAGAQVEPLDLPAVNELAAINASGGFSAAESYAWHRPLLERSREGYDPRVAQRILKGATMKAWEYLDLVAARAAWIERMLAAIAPYDALLSPTVPLLAPPLADLAPGVERDEAFFRANVLLLRNPSVVNMLDGCAISIPCHAPGDLPVGLMIWHGALHDDAILRIAAQAEALLSEA